MDRDQQVTILMATYNGEKYIARQIESILCQTYGYWRLMISDDASTDGTRTIISRYAAAYPDQIRLVNERRIAGSAKKNFMYLSGLCRDAAYIMYADQDDEWLPDKIERTLSEMRRIEMHHPGLPCLVHTDLEVVNEALARIHPSFLAYSGLDGERVQLRHLLIQNVVTGCTMMINHALLALALQVRAPENLLMHDWWFALIASAYGSIGFIPAATIRYRQHGGNAVGAKNTRSLSYKFRQLRNKGNRAALTGTMIQAGELLKLPGCTLPPEAQRAVQAYAGAATRGKCDRIRIVIKYGIWKREIGRRIGELLYL